MANEPLTNFVMDNTLYGKIRTLVDNINAVVQGTNTELLKALADTLGAKIQELLDGLIIKLGVQGNETIGDALMRMLVKQFEGDPGTTIIAAIIKQLSGGETLGDAVLGLITDQFDEDRGTPLITIIEKWLINQLGGKQEATIVKALEEWLVGQFDGEDGATLVKAIEDWKT